MITRSKLPVLCSKSSSESGVRNQGKGQRQKKVRLGNTLKWVVHYSTISYMYRYDRLYFPKMAKPNFPFHQLFVCDLDILTIKIQGSMFPPFESRWVFDSPITKGTQLKRHYVTFCCCCYVTFCCQIRKGNVVPPCLLKHLLLEPQITIKKCYSSKTGEEAQSTWRDHLQMFQSNPRP